MPAKGQDHAQLAQSDPTPKMFRIWVAILSEIALVDLNSNSHDDRQQPGLQPATSLVQNFVWGLGITLALLAFWWAAVAWFAPPPFILPGPGRVLFALYSQFEFLLTHGAITLLEIVLGLIAGTVLGLFTALLAVLFPLAGRAILPIISTSQALPVFAIAPLLVIWFGLGLGSKIAMATLIIYFPVTSALIDGLERTERGLVELGRLYGATTTQLLFLIRLPAAMPSFASGLKVAATIAPIGAIVGEWVGSSAGLGFIILQSNARMQTDIVFAALLVLAIIAISIRSLVSFLADYFIHWAPKTTKGGGL
jgi:putative hydroxymethylpyrimidine transport system permease protein